jgi:hypothetical protein
MWWFEQELTSLRGAFERRRADHDLALDPDVGAFAVVNLLRATFHLWETAAERGEVVDHLPRAVAHLRRAYGVTD